MFPQGRKTKNTNHVLCQQQSFLSVSLQCCEFYVRHIFVSLPLISEGTLNNPLLFSSVWMGMCVACACNQQHISIKG